MNRPLALIQGNLALPNARLLGGLPPPYGMYRWTARAATPRRPQLAVQAAVRHASSPAVHTWLAPGQKFRFFYKASPPRDYSARVAEELAEARNYLEMGKVRARSSRSDHALGAMIFVACSIVLAWLLMSGAAHDADEPATVVAMARPAVATPDVAVAVHAQRPASIKPARSAAEIAPAVAQLASADSLRKATLRSECKPSLQTALPAKPVLFARHVDPHQSARASAYDAASGFATKDKSEPKVAIAADSNFATARPTEAQTRDHEAPARSLSPAPSLAASTQPESPARSSVADATASAVLRDWAAQQRHANVPTRASAPTTAPAPTTTPAPPNADWSAHLTQRRVTEALTAFASPTLNTDRP